MVKIVYALLTLACEGHTNAQCFPDIKYFDTAEQCEQARVVPAKEGMFGHEA